MAIYVDDLFTMTPRNKQAKSHGSKWCHMVTDNADLEELHLMAERIGLKRTYFQPHATLPHYDLIPTKRALAIRYGAVAISAQELVKKNFEAHKPIEASIIKPKRKRKEKPVVERPTDILCADCLATCTLSEDGKRWLCPNPEHNN